jgi:hypothetical protein
MMENFECEVPCQTKREIENLCFSQMRMVYIEQEFNQTKYQLKQVVKFLYMTLNFESGVLRVHQNCKACVF